MISILGIVFGTLVSFHSSYKNILFDIADSFQLEISKPTENFPTRYSDNDQDSNSILDLVFLYPKSMVFNIYQFT